MVPHTGGGCRGLRWSVRVVGAGGPTSVARDGYRIDAPRRTTRRGSRGARQGWHDGRGFGPLPILALKGTRAAGQVQRDLLDPLLGRRMRARCRHAEQQCADQQQQRRTFRDRGGETRLTCSAEKRRTRLRPRTRLVEKNFLVVRFSWLIIPVSKNRKNQSPSRQLRSARFIFAPSVFY